MPPNGPPPKQPDGELPTSPPPPRGNSDLTNRDLLRQNEELHIYKRAMESMAKQFIHPRMTALELAELQLKGNNSE